MKLVQLQPQHGQSRGRNGWFSPQYVAINSETFMHDGSTALVIDVCSSRKGNQAPIVLRLNLQSLRAILDAALAELNEVQL